MSAGAGRQFPTRHGDTHGPGRSDELPWVAEIHMSGTALPTAGRTNTGALFGLRDPSSGSIGTVYSNQSGTVWEEYPVPGGGSAHFGSNTQMQVPLDTPDENGAGYPAYTFNNGFTNVRRIIPAFTKNSGSGVKDGTWEGAIRVPKDYSSSAAIKVSFAVNGTSGAVRWVVKTAVVAAGGSYDSSYTAETAQNITVPGVALERQDVTFTLSTTPAAGDTLNVLVMREGSSASDTCSDDALLWECIFDYTS